MFTLILSFSICWFQNTDYYDHFHLDGLGFESDEIGMVLGIAAVPMLVLNLFIYPFLNRLFGTKKVCLHHA